MFNNTADLIRYIKKIEYEVPNINNSLKGHHHSVYSIEITDKTKRRRTEHVIFG